MGAWIENRMEQDRTLLALASGGIGLHVTLLTTHGADGPWILNVLIAVSIAGFLAAIVLALLVFKSNAAYLERLWHNGEPVHDKKLELLDRWLQISFYGAVVAFVMFGIAAAITHTGDRNMAKNGRETKLMTGTASEEKSLNGLGGFGTGGSQGGGSTSTTTSGGSQGGNSGNSGGK